MRQSEDGAHNGAHSGDRIRSEQTCCPFPFHLDPASLNGVPSVGHLEGPLNSAGQEDGALQQFSHEESPAAVAHRLIRRVADRERIFDHAVGTLEKTGNDREG